MKFCPDCGTNVEGKKFCPECGRSIEEQNPEEVKTQDREPLKEETSDFSYSYGVPGGVAADTITEDAADFDTVNESEQETPVFEAIDDNEAEARSFDNAGGDFNGSADNVLESDPFRHGNVVDVDKGGLHLGIGKIVIIIAIAVFLLLMGACSACVSCISAVDNAGTEQNYIYDDYDEDDFMEYDDDDFNEYDDINDDDFDNDFDDDLNGNML